MPSGIKLTLQSDLHMKKTDEQLHPQYSTEIFCNCIYRKALSPYGENGLVLLVFLTFNIIPVIRAYVKSFFGFFYIIFLPQKHRLRAAVYLIIHALPCIFHSCREACIFFYTDILPENCGYRSSAFLCSLHNYLFRMLCLFLCCVGRIHQRIAYAEFFVFRDCQRMIRQCFDTLYI